MLESDFELNLSYDDEAKIMASFMNDSKPKPTPVRTERKNDDQPFQTQRGEVDMLEICANPSSKESIINRKGFQNKSRDQSKESGRNDLPKKAVNKDIAIARTSSVKKSTIADVSSVEEPVVSHKTVSKFKTIDIKDDPMQYHAKPRELSKNALKRPLAQMSHSSHIFTRVPFSKFKLHKQLSEHIEKSQDDGGMALMSCTRVQSVVISALETKQNILMKSETGSGKTMAYLVPIIDDLLKLHTPVSRSQGTYAIILAPTRELCSQIGDVIDNITKCCVSIVGGCISGGEKRKSEKARLRKGVSILVGTPGRLLDHLRATESFTLNKLRWVVLDEADRLLDMGFEQTILEICSIVSGVVLPGLKQKNDTGGKSGEARTNLVNKWQQNSLHQSKICNETDSLSFIMASATLTKAVKHLAMPLMGGQGFLVVDAERNAVQRINDINDLLSLGKDTGRLDGGVGNDGDIIDMKEKYGVDDDDDAAVGDGHVAKKARAGDLDRDEMVEVPEQLSQYFMMVTCKWRLAALVSFLRIHKDEKVMVFFATCDSVDYHALLFRNTQWPLELDAPLPVHTSEGLGGDKGKAALGPKPSADQFLDPLEYTFTGMFGDDCNMFRLHGNVPQRSRQLVYKQYCKATKGILLCTDVAARGLDLPKVDWIVQYDPPCETTDYVHRIGRTARKGEGGSAVIFLLPTEAPYIQLLQSHGMMPRPLSLQSLFIESSSHIPGVGKFNNIDEMTAVVIQRRVEGVVYRNRYLLDAGRQAFRSFVRAYATHSSDAKGIFKVQSLHLGHVAKCFALRESPHALRNHDDIIGKIFNGLFTQAVLGDDKLKKKNRDEKYALSKKGKSGGSSRGSVHSESGSSKPPSGLAKNEKQKIRKMGGSASLTPSGSFRKTSGYFRKKLRASTTAEFQS